MRLIVGGQAVELGQVRSVVVRVEGGRVLMVHDLAAGRFIEATIDKATGRRR